MLHLVKYIYVVYWYVDIQLHTTDHSLLTTLGSHCSTNCTCTDTYNHTYLLLCTGT